MPRLRSLTGVVTAAAALAVAAPAVATPYDNTFSGDGIATFGGLGTGSPPFEFANATAVQPDGKTLLAGGAVNTGSGTDAMVMRLKQDGTIDETFGSGGRTVVSFSSETDQFGDIVIDPSGRIVASGYARVSGEFDTAIARLNPDGTLDTDSDSTPASVFSEDGKLVIDLAGGIEDYGEGLIVQGSGKPVVLSGIQLVASSSNEYDFGFLRLNEDGTPDGTWGPGGLQKLDLGADAGDSDFPNDLAEQNDDKLVAVGQSDATAGAGVDLDWVFTRLNSDGTLDSGGPSDANPADSFGTGGITFVDFGPNNDTAIGVEALDGNRVVAGGLARPADPNDRDPAVAQLTSAGVLDSGFSGDGKAVRALGAQFEAIDDVAVQPDGKIVAAGGSGSPDSDTFLLRWTSAGNDDASFDGDGLFTGPDGDLNDVAAAPSGRITAVGTQQAGSPPAADVLAIRIHQNDADSDNAADETDNCLGLANQDQANNDGDSQGDDCDPDDDNDGTPDASDAFSKNAAESADSDGDGTGNNADGDDDNDGTPDGSDAFPLNPAESLDTDRDGIGNNADPDDDNDTFPDAEDAFPLDHNRWNAPDPVGTNGNDTLIGSNIANVICGLLGNDRIDGEGGNDVLYGDRCNDKTKVAVGAAQTSDGRDNITGGTGNDRLFGAGGNDKLNGEEGNDKLYGGGGNDKLTGADGNDLLRGDSGRDAYSGGAGNDSISARDGVRESVNCGTGSRDKATVDRDDKVSSNCETVRRPKR